MRKRQKKNPTPGKVRATITLVVDYEHDGSLSAHAVKKTLYGVLDAIVGDGWLNLNEVFEEIVDTEVEVALDVKDVA